MREVFVCVSMSADLAPSSMTIETDAVRAHHVLHEEGGLRDHRPPAGLVPADRAILEHHLQMAVIDLGLGDLVGQAHAHAAHLDRPRIGDLAHDVDIVDAAIDQRRGRLHQPLVDLPGGPEDCWLRFMRMTKGPPSSRACRDELASRTGGGAGYSR